MHSITKSLQPFCRRWAALGIVGLCVATLLIEARSQAAPPAKKPAQPPAKKPGFQKPDDRPTAPPAPRASLLTNEAWVNAPLTPVKSEEIDRLVGRELQAEGIKPAPLTTDEQFLRRVTLDLTGRLPAPAAVLGFVADKDPHKRAKVIDKLLDSDDYARHWARYWRDVIAARVADGRGRALQNAFDQWMTQQLKSDQGWDQIARAMITADGPCRFDDEGQNGANYFLASHLGPDAANEQAAETSRIFLGIRIQCAQCHDHPSDQWKRVQFHELAAYFARVGAQPIREDKKFVGLRLVSRPRGEHTMPDKADPKKALLTHPRFLDGSEAGKDKSDLERRRALAGAIVGPSNYWFAGAYVNRIWGELMGQSFYQPVDDMGPGKEAVMAPVLTRLAASFRATDYDIKALFRVIMKSQTYQRQLWRGEASDNHLHGAAASPARLRANVLWDSLVGVLGPIGPVGKLPEAKKIQGKGAPRPANFFQALFTLEFGYDPSIRPDEVEGSIPQALMLMNSPAINQRMQARADTMLGQVLKNNKEDDAALAALYLHALARKPTDRELSKCRAYIKKIGNRDEAFEDILWALINSTEFQTKR
jgi:hypothetical protein